MSSVIETKLIITDESDDELEVKTTPAARDWAYEVTVRGEVVYLTSDDADALWRFLGEDH